MIFDLPGCTVVSTVTKEDDYEQWVKNRHQGLGGSDIGAICGVNPYSTPRLVYLKKTGQYEDEFSEAAKERMYWGTVLEPIVAEEYSKRTGMKVVELHATLAHKDFPWALANTDRLILDDKGKPYGVLECKAASEYMDAKWSEGELPLYNLYQLNWYLWITGLKFGALACLVGGNKYYFYEIYRNDELLEEIVPKASAFWNGNVRNLEEPPLTGLDADSEYVKDLYPVAKEKSEITFEEPDINILAEAVLLGRQNMKVMEKILAVNENKLKDAMKDNETGYTSDFIVKYTNVNATRVDSAALKSKFPSVYEQCNKTSSYRKMTIKKAVTD